MSAFSKSSILPVLFIFDSIYLSSSVDQAFFNSALFCLKVRKWRKKSALGAVLPWDFEIGLNNEDLSRTINNLDLIENSNNVRKPTYIDWSPHNKQKRLNKMKEEIIIEFIHFFFWYHTNNGIIVWIHNLEHYPSRTKRRMSISPTLIFSLKHFCSDL